MSSSSEDKKVKQSNSFNPNTGGPAGAFSEVLALDTPTLLNRVYTDRKLLKALTVLKTVNSGDQLKTIARSFSKKYPIYNNENWFPIYNFNQKRIICPDLIFPGQELYVPNQELAEKFNHKPQIRQGCVGKPKGIFINPFPVEYSFPTKILPIICGLTGTIEMVFGGHIIFLKAMSYSTLKVKLQHFKGFKEWVRKGVAAEEVAKSTEVSAVLKTEVFKDIADISKYVETIELKGSYDRANNKFLIDLELNSKTIQIDREREIFSNHDFSLKYTGMQFSVGIGALSGKFEIKITVPLKYISKTIEFTGYIDLKLSLDNLPQSIKECGSKIRKWELFPRELFAKALKEALEEFDKKSQPQKVKDGLEWKVVIGGGAAVGLVVGVLYAIPIVAQMVANAINAIAVFFGLGATSGAGAMTSSNASTRGTYLDLTTAIEVILEEERIKLIQ